MSDHKSQLASLKDQAKKNEERATALEDTYERTRKDLEQNERTRDDAIEKRDKVQSDMRKMEEVGSNKRVTL